jgi:type II secretory pathway pseudopilin PulG
MTCFAKRFWRRCARGESAFTLIETMVVVGLVVILLGGVGFALRDTGSSSLASAQNILGSLVGQARAQAAVNQTEARLAIYAVRPPGGDAEKYLRLLQVFVARPQGSSTWAPVGSPVYLPRGVFVVPPTTNGLLASGVTWAVNPAPVSSLVTGTIPNQLAGTPFFNVATVFFIEFKADGSLTPVPAPYTKLAVTTGGVGLNGLPAFNNANAVRGVLIRPTGAVTYVNEATAF